MGWGRLGWVGVVVGAALAWNLVSSCGGSSSPAPQSLDNPDGGGVGGPSDGGQPDGGSDGGRPDGGLPDGGGHDGGVPDGGTDGGISFPPLDGWQFYGPAQGVPSAVVGVTADQGGNIWVAGGEEGLFLLQPGTSTFRRFTMADGLHPYGYLPDGGVPPGQNYLKVLSVAGGPPGTVFVGYAGKPPAAGQVDCDGNWDGPNPDPNIFKSGDADKVALQGNGISVVHYDIFSGPNVVPAEPRGREKLCHILRIAYSPSNHSIWFGGNHGFAWGDANYAGDPTCNGQRSCSGLIEHAHPAFNCWSDESRSHVYYCTDAYYGMSVLPNGDVWAGGANRSTLFRYATYGGDFFRAQAETEAPEGDTRDRFDIWPDLVSEPNYPTPSERVDDNVSDMAAMPDGSVWISSFNRGLANYRPGELLEYRVDRVVDPSGNASALERDPSDGSLWIGYRWGGFARLNGNSYQAYDYRVLGPDLMVSHISDISSDTSQGHRRILVGFSGTANTPGAIGVYDGN